MLFVSEATLRSWPVIRRVDGRLDTGVVKELLTKYAELFAKTPGTMKHIRAHLTLRDGAIPRVRPPRSVPYAIRDMGGGA